jgi:hypothetical protein
MRFSGPGSGSRHGEIIKATGISGQGLTHPLNVLPHLGWIQRERPFSETSDRRSLYRVADPFLHFLYRFGAPLASALRFEDPMLVFRERVSPSIPGYMGLSVFEGVCAQWLQAHARARLGVSIASIGRYWSRDGQTEIDLIAELDDGRMLFGECKWSADTPLGVRVYARLRSKVEGLPFERWKSRAQYVLFATGGFTDELRAIVATEGDVHLVDGAGLFQ